MNVMIDLETFSTKSNAVIVTMAAIKFDPMEQVISLKNMDTFYKRILYESCSELGMHTDIETTEWWETQPEIATKEIFEQKNRIPIKDALTEFLEWIGKDNDTIVWSHGSNFDIVILENALDLCNLKTPWKYWNIRDTRTVFAITDTNLRSISGFPKHHALYDCYKQIICLNKAYNKLFV